MELVLAAAIGKDGKTAYMRRKGKAYKKPLPPFAETVYFLPPGRGEKAGYQNKMEQKYHKGIYAGVLDHSDEMVFLTPEGQSGA